jgi:diguanylate cyclase (GGDEF)-like protein
MIVDSSSPIKLALRRVHDFSRVVVPDSFDNDQDPLLGQVLDRRFELTEYIACGGMGRVYKAVQRPLDRVVAIKLLGDVSQGVEEFQRRFFLEASLCARLSHPNIVRIFDYGCHDDDLYYIAMEYLEGQTIKHLVADQGWIEPLRAIAILKQVCAALIEAHGAGLVHRDLKPSNLFIISDVFGGDFVKILDFGVVKQLSVDMEFTHVGSTLGSPLFMSPEQIRDSDVDGRSDLYSLGVILFQMLTGTFPFTASEPLQVLMKHLNDPPPSLAEANPQIRIFPALERLVRRALEKSKEDRFSDARDMLQALIEVESQLGTVQTDITDLMTVGAERKSLEALRDMPTGPMSTISTDLDVVTAVMEMGESDARSPIVAEEIQTTETTSVDLLLNLDLHGFVAFIDFNCPYCFALHERICRWGGADKVDWCLVEHAAHLLDGPFDLDQEQMLSTEVHEVHHRAPDVGLVLPPQRCRSTTATRLAVYVRRHSPEKGSTFRHAVYRALWQDGLDIGERSVLVNLLIAHDLPPELIDECSEEPMELTAWQSDWDSADFDHCIPVLTHPASDRVLIGLADERTLMKFFLGERTRVVDTTVCYYQQQPSILVCGSMSHLWQMLTDVRGCCEILQAPNPKRAMEYLSEIAVPDLVILDGEYVDYSAMEALSKLAKSRSVPWVVATRAPSPDEEIRALAMGAVEYLPVVGESQVARARLSRILRDRYNLDRVQKETKKDLLTKLPTRAALLEKMEIEWDRAVRSGSMLSFVLLDIDAFKLFNKTHGYLSGDQILIRLANRLAEEVHRSGDVFARFGGNEFAVLLPNTNLEEAEALLAHLCKSAQDERIVHRASGQGFLSVSGGAYSMKPAPTTSLHELLDGAFCNLQSRREEQLATR